MSVESSALNVERSAPHGAVFLSYASQDAEAAKRICEALRAAGVEVWFDQSELVGGDAWDQKIRKQIRECALLIPVISKTTQGRREAYFRLEWKLADERTHLMAKGTPFLLPVTIDETSDRDALVPDSFLAVQWTKAPAGETPAAFAGRVKKLLGGEAVFPAGAPLDYARSEAKHGRRQATPLLKTWLVAALVIVAVAAGIWTQLRNHGNAAGPAAAPAKAESPVGAPAAPLTEAQKLVVKARQILDDGDELNREIFFLAEDLVKRAIDLDPAEPSARAFYAELSYWMTWQGFDNSEARRDLMRRQAERARSLAPDSMEVQIAVANVRIRLSQDLPGLERDLLVLAAREPKNWRVQRALGMTYRYLNRPDDALASLRRARDLSNELPLASADLVNVLLRRGRFAEAETIVAQALAKGSSGRLLTFDVLIKTLWRGDRAGAAAAIAAWPDWLRLEDRGAAQAWRSWLWSDQPEKALAAAQRLPRDYLNDTFFTGPRAVLTARAHERAGHTDSARSDWRTVVQICDRELTSGPENFGAQFWKAWALARLGDTAAAQALCTQMEQRNLLANNWFTGSNEVPALWATVGRTDRAFAELRVRRPDEDRIAVTRMQLELDPAFEPLRADPRYKEVLAAAPAPEKTPAAFTTPAVDDKSVAVLAFANLSDDKGNEYFSDGISEELLNVLAKVPGLKVSARTSAFYFKGKEVPIPEIAQKLGVAYVVEGSVRKQGDKVRITAQLIKATDGFHVWSDTFTRDLKDIFAVQDEIAGLIAKNLSVQMGVVARVEHQVNPEALALLLEGRHFWALRSTEGFARAGELFSQAVKLDPQWAPAYAALASLQSIQGSYQRNRGEALGDLQARASQAARRAIELDPTLGEPYAALGHIAMDELRWSESGTLFAKALVLEPNNATVIDWNADLASGGGRLDDALAGYQRALELDPLAPFILWDTSWFLLHARRYGEALALIERMAGLTSAGTGRVAVRRAFLLMKLGRRAEAESVLLPALPGLKSGWDGFIVHEAIECLRALGRQREAEQLAVEMLKLRPDDPSNGFILVALGRTDEAYAFLERTSPIMRQIIFWDPMLDPLRDNPRFRQVLEKLACTEGYKVARATLARMLREQGAKK